MTPAALLSTAMSSAEEANLTNTDDPTTIPLQWHNLPVEVVKAHLKADMDRGLSDAEASKRIAAFGRNNLGLSTGPSAFKVLMGNVFNPMNFVLVIAIAFASAVQDIIQIVVLAIIIVINSFIGFLQEYRSEKTMAALRSLASPTARILRSSKLASLPSEGVVPGDIIFLEEGDQVPADLRLFEAVNLQIDEMLLIGESLPVTKTSGLLSSCVKESSASIAPGQVAVSEQEPLDHVPLGDRKNLAFSSTIVTRGRGKGIVIATGRKTEVGHIAEMLQDTSGPSDSEKTRGEKAKLKFLTIVGWGVDGDGKTPLQHTMDRMMLILLGCAILLAVVVFGAQKFNFGQETALYAISVAIAIVPEGLPAVLTVTFAVGVKTMAKQKALVRQIASVEALGMVTNICSDKTGTLTEGRMSVKSAWVAGKNIEITGTGVNPTQGHVEFDGKVVDPTELRNNYLLAEFAACIGLCNNSILHAPEGDITEWQAIGDPTEIALQVLAHRLQFIRAKVIVQRQLDFVHEHPFDATLKRMSVVYSTEPSANDTVTEVGEGAVLARSYLKGSLESVLECCEGYYDENGVIVKNVDAFRPFAEENMKRVASQGLRVLGLAHRVRRVSAIVAQEHREKDESRYIFLGLVGMYDPPRKSSASSVQSCRDAGIVVHMATGDHVDTATAIAKQIGILRAGQEHLVLTASQFDNLSENEVDAMPDLPLVLARCSPQTKVKFIHALHRRGKFVAMTGDGTNDAPAIKLADIGIAMGLNGSDVAKEASQIVLTDDNFASIVAAVKEGRRIFANVVKLALSFLSTNVAEIVALIFALGIRSQRDGHAIFPMSPLQVLWINLMTSTPIALGLASERAAANVMKKRPRGTRAPDADPREPAASTSIFTREFIWDNIVFGSVIGALSLAAFMISLFNSETGTDVDTTICNAERNDLDISECDGVFRSRAVMFLTIGLTLLVHGWNCRDERLSLFCLPMFPAKTKGNRTLLFGLVIAFVLLIIPVYVPVLNVRVFKQKGIGWEWCIVGGAIVLFVLLSEIYKAGKRRFYKDAVHDREALP